MPRRTAIALAATLASLSVVAGLATEPAAADTASKSGAPPRASVVATKQIDGRLLELTVSTPALAADTKVRVLLPTGYTAASGAATRSSTSCTAQVTTTPGGHARAMSRT